MRYLILILSIFFVINATAQKDILKGRFSYEVSRVVGDLNKDKLEDVVLVTQDTLNNTWPYHLQVFFKQPDGSHKAIISTDKMLPPLYADGINGYRDGNSFGGIEITNGILTIWYDLLRGYYKHIFRYQKDNFELIGFNMISSDGIGKMYTTDFNLSTGVLNYKEDNYETDKTILKFSRKITVSPLPKLQNFIPLEAVFEDVGVIY